MEWSILQLFRIILGHSVLLEHSISHQMDSVEVSKKEMVGWYNKANKPMVSISHQDFKLHKQRILLISNSNNIIKSFKILRMLKIRMLTKIKLRFHLILVIDWFPLAMEDISYSKYNKIKESLKFQLLSFKRMDRLIMGNSKCKPAINSLNKHLLMVSKHPHGLYHK
jgi:hypothetical protein